MKNKLLVPRTVSFNARGTGRQLHNETKAFVPLWDDPAWLASKRRKRRLVEPLPNGLSSTKKHELLREIAHNSEYFTKPTSVRAIKILQALNHFGVRTEKLMQNMGNGRSLFKKSGYGLDSIQGTREFCERYAGNVKTVQKMIAQMHGIGITHGHLHIGNISIDKGKIVFLDSFRARFLDFSLKNREIPTAKMLDFSLKSRAESIVKMRNDLWEAANGLARMRLWLKFLEGKRTKFVTPQETQKINDVAQSIVNGIINKYPKTLRNSLHPVELLFMQSKHLNFDLPMF